MLYPFQCLHHCLGDNNGRENILVAASGSCIYCFDIVSENLLSVWTPQQAQEHPLNKAIDADAQEPKDFPSSENAHLASVRPSKRQKVSSLDEGSGSASADPPSEDGHDIQAGQPNSPRTVSAVIKLIGSRNGRYIIAVTDDKYVRVLEFLPDNSLKQLTERYNLA